MTYIRGSNATKAPKLRMLGCQLLFGFARIIGNFSKHPQQRPKPYILQSLRHNIVKVYDLSCSFIDKFARLLGFRDDTAFWTLAKFCVSHPVLDDGLQLGTEVCDVQRLLANDSGLRMRGGLAVPPQTV